VPQNLFTSSNSVSDDSYILSPSKWTEMRPFLKNALLTDMKVAISDREIKSDGLDYLDEILMKLRDER
jgi:hypothetical protein